MTGHAYTDRHCNTLRVWGSTHPELLVNPSFICSYWRRCSLRLRVHQAPIRPTQHPLHVTITVWHPSIVARCNSLHLIPYISYVQH